MGGILGRVAESYNDSDDEMPPYGVELMDANPHAPGDAALELPIVENAIPGSVSPLMFGGNVFPNGNPNDPMQELMLPLLRRLARNTAQISQTRTVLCPVNVNKDSIKLVPRITASNPSPSSTVYDIQFTFDATEACNIKVFLCVDESFSNGSFEYLDARNGSRVGCVPSNTDFPASNGLVSQSSSSSPVLHIEKRFSAGLGQTFFSIGAEALDISQFSIAHLTWNQLEQQMEADRAFARNGDADSDGSNSDGEAAANEREEDEEDANEDEERSRPNDSGSDDEDAVSQLDVIDEEAGLAQPSRRSTRSGRGRRNGKKKKMPAMPRPKPMDEPLVVRNLYPIVIAIEPIIDSANADTKPVVEAQITHACLYSVSTSGPSTTSKSTQDSTDEQEDGQLATSSGASASSSSSAAPSSSNASSSATSKYDARVLRQKLFVNGSTYNVYDIFGVEADDPSAIDSDIQSSCVICMSEPRTTIVMPCRHMCLCEGCAESLKVQSVKCPICRGPVRGLLKVNVDAEDEQDEEEEGEAEEGVENVEVRPVRRERRVSDSDSDPAEEMERLRLSDSEEELDANEDEDDNVHASLVRSAK